MSKLYTPRTAVARYYLFLFSLPKWQFLAGALVVITILSTILLKTKSIPIILNSVLTLAVITSYRKINPHTVFWKTKRVVGLALAVAVYSTIYTVITGAPVIPVASSVTLLTVVILGLDGTSAYRYLIASTPPALTLVISNRLELVSHSEMLYGILLVVVFILLDVGIYLFMSRKRIGKLGLADLGTLFLRNWLDKKPDIEEFFEKTGETEVVRPRILEFPDFMIVYTDVHYGPFSNVGSSTLPEKIKRLFYSIRGKEVLPVHGLGSHDRNIVSNRYSDRYLEEFEKLYSSSSHEKLLYYGAFSCQYKSWRALGVVFNKVSLVFVSRPIKGIDDLPYRIQVKFEEKASKLGLGDLIIIDSHNWELVSEEKAGELEILEEMIDRLISEIARIRESRKPVEVESRFASFSAKAPGLIAGEGHIFCIGGGGREEVCVVYLRGNNMKPGVRDKILERLTPLNTSLTEVITNDEHSETATRSHIIYVPVHESPDLLDNVERAVREISNKPKSVGAFYTAININTKIMGESAVHLEKVLKSSVREAGVLLPLYVFATPVVVRLFTLVI